MEEERLQTYKNQMITRKREVPFYIYCVIKCVSCEELNDFQFFVNLRHDT